MKYVLVNKFDEIVDKVDLAGNVGKTGATTYFQGMKKMPEREEFENLIFKASLQNRQMGNRKYEWWKEEPSGPDEDFDY